MKSTAIVLAAGKGKRMNSSIHKQYLLLAGRPVICYSLETFQKCPFIDEIILVAGEGEDKLAIAGGVASNSTLRTAMERACRNNKIKFYHPSPILCTDNAAMIGAAAYYEYIRGTRHGLDLNAVPNLKLGERI